MQTEKRYVSSSERRAPDAEWTNVGSSPLLKTYQGKQKDCGDSLQLESTALPGLARMACAKSSDRVRFDGFALKVDEAQNSRAVR